MKAWYLFNGILCKTMPVTGIETILFVLSIVFCQESHTTVTTRSASRQGGKFAMCLCHISTAPWFMSKKNVQRHNNTIQPWGAGTLAILFWTILAPCPESTSDFNRFGYPFGAMLEASGRILEACTGFGRCGSDESNQERVHGSTERLRRCR